MYPQLVAQWCVVTPTNHKKGKKREASDPLAWTASGPHPGASSSRRRRCTGGPREARRKCTSTSTCVLRLRVASRPRNRQVLVDQVADMFD